MIARTIGAPSGKGRARQATVPVINVAVDTSTTNGHGTHDDVDADEHVNGPQLSLSYPADSFSNPGELLSGEGLFSPPQSRPGSPGVQRKRHRSESVTSAGEGSVAASWVMDDEAEGTTGLDLRSDKDKALRKRTVGVAPMTSAS